MSPLRFVVQTVTGYAGLHDGGSRTPGLSAHVCDRLNLYHVVGTWRSEQRTGTRNERYGLSGAIEAAQALADRLNRDTA